MLPSMNYLHLWGVGEKTKGRRGPWAEDPLAPPGAKTPLRGFKKRRGVRGVACGAWAAEGRGTTGLGAAWG